ncbi:hypothetical protein DKM44_04345 [Deinococcus irradiatisoli]|uniref:DUF4142 domain-containing protein n=1 Tax=Deinococcus irradiatisoli TaxID=2202254 RepID=A0A2Z3JEZ4_9DEIO|nr:DUF4142 domain-containing protein [Deinococcus irradiatisoli]AWN22556.1 hypothetical protein DKM44_04345 [Deinococcus irradiatisoli]
MTSLRGLDGITFDVTYLAQQISAHNKAIVLFKSYSQAVNSPDESVRQFADQTLPVMQKHLQMALDQQKSLGNSSSGSK